MDKIVNYNFMTKPAKHCLDKPNDWYKQWGITRGNLNELDLFNMSDGDIIFVKTDFIFNGTFAKQYLRLIEKKFILITGVSSYSIDEGDQSYLDILNSPYLIKWFCTNPPKVPNPKIEWLPIGMEEPEREGGDVKVINKFYDNSYIWNDKLDRLYIPFHGNTYHSRNNIISELSNLDFVDLEPSKLKFSDYLEKMSKYKYVLSLRGAGWDCHRHYESLLVDSVPVMDGGPLMKNFIKNKMPVIDVKDINNSIFSKKWNFKISKEKLLSEYYINKIFKCQKDFLY